MLRILLSVRLGEKEDTIITAREYDRKARGEVRAGSAVSRERMLSQ